MSETFCCMICRLLQQRSPACVECGAATMVSLQAGSEALKFSSLALQTTGETSAQKAANWAGAAAMLAGYAGVWLAATFFWPAIPVALAATAGGITLTTRASKTPIVAVPLHAVTTRNGAVDKRGTARKLADSVKSVDGESALVEQIVIRKGSGVLLRHVAAVPFVVDADGERVVVAGTLRVLSPPTTRKLKKGDPLYTALGIPAHLAIAAVADICTVRDGAAVAVRGTPSVEMIAELAFHRDAGETTVLRGVANDVVTIA